jgi:hypothetical protein
VLTYTQGTCTLREAQIISAVLARVSIPVLHSAAAIKTLCDIAAEQASQQSECVSATNFMLKVLLEKKYALRASTSVALSYCSEANTNLDSVAMCGFARLPFPPLRGGRQRHRCPCVIAGCFPPVHACVCAAVSQRQ